MSGGRNNLIWAFQAIAAQETSAKVAISTMGGNSDEEDEEFVNGNRCCFGCLSRSGRSNGTSARAKRPSGARECFGVSEVSAGNGYNGRFRRSSQNRSRDQ